MKHHNLIQGSPEWHAYRKQHRNASDAPAMMGVSSYKTRSELVKEVATGEEKPVDARTAQRFADGHRFEALARSLCERIVGEDLFPVVGSEGIYSASFDGLTMLEDTASEHKSMNDRLRQAFSAIAAAVDQGMTEAAAVRLHLPLEYRIQMEQQAMVSGCARVLFMATKWQGETLLESGRCWYTPDAELRAAIVAGWEQFDADVAAYKAPDATPIKAVGQKVDELPALVVQVQGSVVSSNLDGFKAAALKTIRGLNRELTTDQDFADAEESAKFCADVEERIELAKAAVLAQTADVDLVLRTLDSISEEARAVRLALTNGVKARKDELKADRIRTARAALAEHVATLNAELSRPVVQLPAADFAAAIKGKRSLATVDDAIATLLASAKASATVQAGTIRANLGKLAELAADKGALFPDLNTLLLKSGEDFEGLVRGRLAQHQAEEAARLAREQAAAAVQQAARAAAPAPAVVTSSAPLAIDLCDDTRKGGAFGDVAGKAVQAVNDAAAELPTLKLGDINKRLGTAFTADFLATLGHVAQEVRGAKLYRPSDFPRICDSLAAHFTAIGAQLRAAA